MIDVSVTLRPPCLCPFGRGQTWRLRTKLYKFGWHTSANNTRMKNNKDQAPVETCWPLALARLFIYQSSIISQTRYFNIHWMVTIFSFDHMTNWRERLAMCTRAFCLKALSYFKDSYCVELSTLTWWKFHSNIAWTLTVFLIETWRFGCYSTYGASSHV